MDNTLDVTYIETLLSLPCFNKGSCALTKTPILATSTKTSSCEFVHDILDGESIGDFLKRIHNGSEQYDMDSSIYAQLASFVLTGRWPKNGGKINLYVANKIGALKLWKKKIPQMGYIAATNDDVARILMKFSINPKGCWVIQISDNSFLGLSDKGSCMMTMEQWTMDLYNKLREFSNIDPSELFEFDQSPELSLHPTKSSLYAVKRLINIYFRQDKLNKWGVPFQSGLCFRKGFYTSIGSNNKT